MVLRQDGVLLQSHPRLEDAVALNSRGLELDPLSTALYVNFGMTLEQAGRFAEAEAAYLKAQELLPHPVASQVALVVAA